MFPLLLKRHAQHTVWQAVHTCCNWRREQLLDKYRLLVSVLLLIYGLTNQ